MGPEFVSSSGADDNRLVTELLYVGCFRPQRHIQKARIAIILQSKRVKGEEGHPCPSVF